MVWTVEDRSDHVVVTTCGTFTVAEHRRMVEDIVSRDFWRAGTDARLHVFLDPEEALVWLLRDE